MGTVIGYNDGIAAAMNRLRDLDPKGTIMQKDSKGKWPQDLAPIEVYPLDQWKAYDKLQRTLEILKADNDARAGGTPNPDPPDPPDPPQTKRYAPRTHNLGNRDQDPRFCCKAEYGVQVVTHPQHGQVFQDEMGACYDLDKMLNVDGLRERAYMVPGLKGADSMDGLEPCTPYSANGISVPPYPGDPYAQTGSYHR